MEATSRNIATGTREEVMELVVDAPVVQVLLEPQVQVKLRLPFVEQIVDEPVLQERFVPVDVPQVIEQLVGVTMSSSQDRILHSTREKFLDVPVPRMMEQFGKRCLRWCLKTEYSDGLPSRSGFNSVLLSRTSNILRMSLSHTSRRKVSR